MSAHEEEARMSHRYFARTAVAIAATAIASLGLAATTAQAATSNPHASHSAVKTVKLGASPRFSCDANAPAVCVFQGANFSGNPAVPFSPSTFGETWTNLVTYGFSLPWGSFYDDSGSSVVFGDGQTGITKCYVPGSRISEPEVVNDRWMWIEFGNTECTGS